MHNSIIRYSWPSNYSTVVYNGAIWSSPVNFHYAAIYFFTGGDNTMYPVRFPTVALTTESYFKIVKFGAVEIKIKVNVCSCVALHIISI